MVCDGYWKRPMKTEPTIKCDEMTIEEMTARRDALMEKRRELLVKLRDAQRTFDDARRDKREADAGSRWGTKLTQFQIAESKRIWNRAIDLVKAVESELSIVDADTKRVNIALSAALNAREGSLSPQREAQREAQRAARRAERRANPRRQHDERIIVLLAAARGFCDGADPELWASRLRTAVNDLSYCDTSIEGEAVAMPWGDEDCDED